MGWEIVCLGRTGSGEKFAEGEVRMRTLVQRDGEPVWLERAQLKGGGRALSAPGILAGQPVAATFVAASTRLENSLVQRCREIETMTGMSAVTAMPDLLIARYLGSSSEAAKNYFIRLWSALRPALAGRRPVEPRIWRT
jgi:urease accessory protein